MKASSKKLFALLILLLFLIPLGMAIKKIYKESRQPELNDALIAAVKQNDTAAVVALLAQGADANARDLPPDERSIWLRLWDCLRRKHLPTSNSHTALTTALCYFDGRSGFPPENVPLIKALLNAGAVVNGPDEDGSASALRWATISQKYETVRLLLERGARVNQNPGNDGTALRYASSGDDPDLVELFLAHGALVNVRTAEKRTPLHEASLSGTTMVVRMLLAKGAEVNVQDAAGESPLSEAVDSESADCVQRLLSKGANVHTTDIYGYTPLGHARRSHNFRIVKLLKKVGAKE